MWEEMSSKRRQEELRDEWGTNSEGAVEAER